MSKDVVAPPPPGTADAPGSSGQDVTSQGHLPLAAGAESALRRLSTNTQPLWLEWVGLGCGYRTGQGVKVALADVSGRVGPGEMLALVGPSGAGKSTLMDLLAGRKSGGSISGKVLVNSVPRGADFARRTAYVPQEDNFVPCMTVAEVMRYSAALLLPRRWGAAARRERTDAVLHAMGLPHVQKTLVGGQLPGGFTLRGLSGGERKRLSIGIGILASPSLLFLDEPTSGLDAHAALSVMAYLASLRGAGQAIVAVVHQPRAAIWELFDSVLLVSGGLQLFYGPREEMVPWFSLTLGYPYQPTLHGVPSDWVMDLVNIGFDKPQEFYGRMMTTRAQLEEAAAAYRKHRPRFLAGGEDGAERGAGAAAVVTRPPPPHTSPTTDGGASAAAADVQQQGREHEPAGDGMVPGGVDGAHVAAVMAKAEEREARGRALRRVTAALCCWDGGAGASRASWWGQFRVLLWREMLLITRNPADVAGRLLVFCWVGLFVGLIFWDLAPTLTGVANRLSLLFVQATIFLLLPFVYMSLYTSDKQHYAADCAARRYAPSAYYLAKAAALLPFSLINCLVFSYTLYGMAGLRLGSGAVAKNGAISLVLYLIAAQVLYCSAVVTPNQDAAFMVAIAWTAVNMLLSNYMVRYSQVWQQWLAALRWLSAEGYSFDGYVAAEFAGLSYNCSQGLEARVVDALPAYLPNATQVRSPFVTSLLRSPGPTCVLDMDALLGYYGIDLAFWTTLVILLGYLGVVHLLTFGGLLLVARKERQ